MTKASKLEKLTNNYGLMVFDYQRTLLGKYAIIFDDETIYLPDVLIVSKSEFKRITDE